MLLLVDPRSRRILCLFLACIVGGCGAIASSSPEPTDGPCARTAAVMLDAADLGEFTMFGDGPVETLGLHGIGPHPIDSAFRGGWSRMWITTMVLSGPYRDENDALARQFGSPIDELPLVPLQGSIVADHPKDPLEVYERVFEFIDAAWASEWLDIARGSVRPQGPSLIALNDARLGDEAQAMVEPGQVIGSTATESMILVEARVGDTVVALTVRGGPGLTVERVSSLAVEAVSRWRESCEGP
jgi:hypothetical protein